MINNRIKFRHLQCFLAVVQQRGLQKAALKLSITQPAVSKTIKELEEILQVRLFDRNRKETVLTRHGEIFFSHAETSVNALQRGSDLMQRDFAEPLIRIGTTPTLAASFLSPVLQRFRGRASNIKASIITGTTGHLLAQLRERKFDLVLCRDVDAEEMAGLSFEYLFVDPMVLVVRPGHPLLQGPITNPADLRRYTAVLPIGGSVSRHAADTYLLAHGLPPPTDFIESLSIFLSRSYTANTDAVWYAPLGVVKQDVASGYMVKLALPPGGDETSERMTLRPTGLMMHAGSVMPVSMQIMVNVIREYALERRGETE
ncbi:LysR family transcriptional regulator [Oxalobacteraceae bacterium CAVE-383]|nr:LysR family transcriptional regulator [Oxalobacteraceae bacterium CAVE-383]